MLQIHSLCLYTRSISATPERPRNVTAVEVTTTSVTLEWVEPHDNNAPIRGYKVSHTLPSFLEGTDVTVNITVEEVNISVLHPGVAYVFSVVAFNEIGDSPPGSVMVTTVESGMPCILTSSTCISNTRHSLKKNYNYIYLLSQSQQILLRTL